MKPQLKPGSVGVAFARRLAVALAWGGRTGREDSGVRKCWFSEDRIPCFLWIVAFSFPVSGFPLEFPALPLPVL